MFFMLFVTAHPTKQNCVKKSKQKIFFTAY